MIPTIIHADMREALAELPEASVDAVLTDPPYHLTTASRGGSARQFVDNPYGRARVGTDKGFMGKTWDGGDVALRPETWAEVLRVLKPGGHVFAFGGTRTFHRQTCAIEDAGFEVRDCFMWLYGTGFPKSRDVRKAAGAEGLPGGDDWLGWGTAAKPAWEPIILARKPLAGTVAANVLAHGTGALNIDGCRVPTDDDLNGGAYAQAGGRAPLAGDDRSGAAAGMFQAGKTAGTAFQSPAGRWPANVLHDGSDEVEAAFAQFGQRPGQQGRARTDGAAQGNAVLGALRHVTHNPEPRGDSGTASRFFFSAKATAADRAGSKHPTVKPIAMLRWLARLITPPGGVILDPFAGSGTTGAAALAEGFQAILIEREAEYIADIRRRFTEAAPLFAEGA